MEIKRWIVAARRTLRGTWTPPTDWPPLSPMDCWYGTGISYSHHRSPTIGPRRLMPRRIPSAGRFRLSKIVALHESFPKSLAALGGPHLCGWRLRGLL